MATFEVVERIEDDLHCRCTDSGLLLPHAKLSFWRAGKMVDRSIGLPTLSSKVNVYFFIAKQWNRFVLILPACLKRKRGSYILLSSNNEVLSFSVAVCPC